MLTTKGSSRPVAELRDRFKRIITTSEMRILSHVSVCVVWMVLSVAATEYYETPDNDEFQIENENKLDAEGSYEQFERAEEDLRKNRLFKTLMQYLQNLKDLENEGPSPKVEDEDVIWPDIFGLKKVGIKKWMAALSNASSKLIPRSRSQRKWKIKKGTSVVCYFKLCSFKPIT